MAVLALMIVLLPVMSQAGTWKKNSTGWWWQEDNGSWPANQWKYIHGTWYAFDGMAICAPDGTGMDGSGII